MFKSICWTDSGEIRPADNSVYTSRIQWAYFSFYAIEKYQILFFPLFFIKIIYLQNWNLK